MIFEALNLVCMYDLIYSRLKKSCMELHEVTHSIRFLVGIGKAVEYRCPSRYDMLLIAMHAFDTGRMIHKRINYN